MRNKAIQGLLLAAGSSTRFGTDKRWAELAGKPLWCRALEPIVAVLDRVVIVVRTGEAAAFSACVADCVDVIECSRTDQGLSASLATGMAQIDANAVLVALADMPAIATASIAKLCASHPQGGLTVPAYNGKWGHPRIFDQQYFTALANVHGDKGARELIELNRHNLHIVSLDDEGILQDVDEPDDLLNVSLPD